MENASKALLMAASILVGTVILSLAAYLYFSFSSSANQIGQQMEEGQLQQFNNQFTVYTDDIEGNNIYEVITVANLAKDNNSYYDLTSKTDNNFYIEVILDNTRLETRSNLEQTYLNDAYRNKKYKCKVSYNPNTGRVNRIEFSEQ